MGDRIKRIGVLTSGGDAPGMNAAVRAVVRTAVGQGIECIGIRRGWSGLISSDFVQLDGNSVSRIINKGGTMLYTARSEEFMDHTGREKAIGTCKLLGLDGIVAIGGDGTFRGALAISRQAAKDGMDLRVVGIPATIDNDIGCSHYTIGFDSACNTAIECIDKLRDTMQSHERCSVVEVMGRHAGHVALNVGVACGATAVLVPEQEVDYEKDVVEPIRRSRLSGQTHFMVIVAEGVEGGAYGVAKRITDETALDTRVTILGHVQRGGTPTSRDRIAATYMGYEAVHLLSEGQSCRVVAKQGNEYTSFDIHEALAMTKGLDPQTYTVMRTLTGVQ